MHRHAFAFYAATALSICAGVAFGAPLTSASGTSQFVLTDIGTLGGSESAALGINNSGQIVGYSTLASRGAVHAFIYQNGTMSDIGAQLGAGNTSSYAYDINDAGTVVGLTTTGSITNSFVYPDDGVSSVGNGAAFAVNESGTVVGRYYPSPYLPGHGFTMENGVVTDIGTLGGAFSALYGINDYGVAVGESHGTENESSYAILYQDGQIESLGILGGTAIDINNSNQIAGYYWTQTSDNFSHAFYYFDGQLVDIGTLGGNSSYGHAINESGVIVGSSLTGNGSESHAFIYADGVMTDLSLLPEVAAAGWDSLVLAYDINDHGEIVGFGFKDGEVRAFLLSPVPEPETWTMLLVGLGLIFGRSHWRTRQPTHNPGAEGRG